MIAAIEGRRAIVRGAGLGGLAFEAESAYIDGAGWLHCRGRLANRQASGKVLRGPAVERSWSPRAGAYVRWLDADRDADRERVAA